MEALETYITICMWCGLALKQRRDSKIQENWERVDQKTLEGHPLTLSDGVCPACTENMSEEDRRRQEAGERGGNWQMTGKYTKANTRQRFTMSEKDVERCNGVFLAFDAWNERNREAAEVWCGLNPWSRVAGGTSAMVRNAARSYLDAAQCERKGITARVVRITDKDVDDLLRYRDRYMKTEGGLPVVR